MAFSSVRENVIVTWSVAIDQIEYLYWSGIKPMSFMFVLMLLANWVPGVTLQMLLAMFIDGNCLFILIAFLVT